MYFTFWTVTPPTSIVPTGVCSADGTDSNGPGYPTYSVTKCNEKVAAGSSVQVCLTGGGGNGYGSANGTIFQWTAEASELVAGRISDFGVENEATAAAPVSGCPVSTAVVKRRKPSGGHATHKKRKKKR